MSFTSFNKIPQFRNAVTTIVRKSQFKGLDENGEAILDPSAIRPSITFHGTVKLHGTNASVALKPNGETYAQSRKNIITPTKDNAGFATYVHSNSDFFKHMLTRLRTAFEIEDDYSIAIFGEWAGKGIQKGVAIAEFDKAFYPFALKVFNDDLEEDNYYINLIEPSVRQTFINIVKDEDKKVRPIFEFKTYSVDVDFNYPQLSQNRFVEIVDEVEKECPVAKAMGITGVGEGVVWEAFVNGDRATFKTKGEKHSVSKVKTVAQVDVEKLNSIKEFVDYAVTENRFEQGFKEIFPDGVPDIKKMGNLIRWVVNDVIDEELDTMTSNGLEPKDVNKYVSTATRNMFFERQNNYVS